jgi:CMP-2-keto-3-deoxyoctulosonic acid synthetase
MQNLIVHKLITLYHIFEELRSDLNFNVVFVDNEKSLNDSIKKFNEYLIVSNDHSLIVNNLFILDSVPINIFKFIEIINIEFLKIQFNNQSKIKINNYILDLNSRELFKNNTRIKLTEKEVNTIIYLSKSNKPVNIDELKKKVWSYHNSMETHTVETHIYRLRKKILNNFSDNKFIISKNDGYQI